MVKRIVVAMDGSMLAREAFEYAVAVAEAAGVPLDVIHVREPAPPVPVGGPDDGFLDIGEALEGCRRVASFHEVRLDIKVTSGVLTECLERAASPSTLIVVGMKGRFASVGVGSTTRWLVQHARGPVMVVTGPSHRQLGRVLAVADGTPESYRAVAVARDLASRAGWPLTVLALPMAGALDSIVACAAHQAPAAGIVVDTTGGRSAAERIEAAVVRYAHALPVMGAYPDSWFNQLVRGGTTGHVLRNLRAPIVLVP